MDTNGQGIFQKFENEIGKLSVNLNSYRVDVEENSQMITNLTDVIQELEYKIGILIKNIYIFLFKNFGKGCISLIIFSKIFQNIVLP